MPFTKDQMSKIQFAVIANRVAMDKINDTRLTTKQQLEAYEAWKNMSVRSWMEAGMTQEQAESI